uniref:Uncharacterized protein n=1 Tax=Tetradesmus obliquus TaxID=3088 RepID=A0A383W9J7_TETOB|eukprot:jgi/Sobl393_1/3259/SZX73779.1
MHSTAPSATATCQPAEHLQQPQQQPQQQPEQQPEQRSMTRVDSSGLPSALTVPTAAIPTVTLPVISDSMVAAPSALVSPTPAKQQHQPIPKVRWLLGDKQAQQQHQQQEQQQQQHKQYQQHETKARQGNLKVPAGQLVAAVPDAARPPARVSGSGSSSFKQGQLPPSGNEQLDRYLQYLLQDAPHKFMYYPQWGLSEQGCAAVAEFLRRDKRIKVMTLSGNAIRDEGIDLVAEALASNSSLLCLDLSDNKIGDAGAIALAEALHSNRTLAELQLSNNRIGDEGAEALAAAVASSSALKKLQLSGNRVSTVQLQVVQHVLKTRVYKMPTRQASSSSLKGHMRKSSSLQFHIELTDSDEVMRSAARHKHQLPPATAIAALSEPLDTLEESLAAQASQLCAELQSSSMAACAASPAADDAAGSSSTDLEQPQELPRCCSEDLLAELALRLAQRGYEVALRTSCPCRAESSEAQAAGQQEGPPPMIGLRHSFIRVVQPGMETSPAIVVDPCFREQFETPHATDRYASVLAVLPSVLCLAESRLWHLVEALSSESKTAFKDAGMSCPPWRDASTVLDKWLGRQPQDVAVDPEMTLQQLRTALSRQVSSSGGGGGRGGQQ